MPLIYTAMDIGSNTIKIVVAEKYNNNFNVIANTMTPSEGIKNGEIVDMKQAITSVKKAVREIEDKLGIKITKTIVCIPPNDSKMTMMQSTIDISDNSNISGADISNAINLAIKGNVTEDKEVIVVCPVSFSVDNIENIKDPKNMMGNKLSLKAVVALKDKERVYKILEVLKLSGVEAVDICFTSTGDYFTFKNSYMDANVGAVINIGYESTNISIFNHGIQIKNQLINIGSRNIDDDISYIFKINNKKAKELKENFALAQEEISDKTEIQKLKDLYDDSISINQSEISKIIEARLNELMSICKKSILNLTNRKISYIIITGGTSGMIGLQNIVDKYFNGLGQISKINIVGIRNNAYSSAYGSIKYLDDKLQLRGKTISTISDEELNKIVQIDEKTNKTSQKKSKFQLFDI